MVIDRSGSMSGEKLKQAKDAALQVLEGLDDGEAFNFMVYNEQVHLFAEAPVLKNPRSADAARAYINGLNARGGTNLHAALGEALRQQPNDNMLPIVLFLTDGLPTIGETSERAITRLATVGNAHQRRVFTFGVGMDVNTPLLEKIGSDTRAKATFVLPGEDVEVKVAQVFRSLAGPVMADPRLRFLDAENREVRSRIQDVAPDKLFDIFDGDQVVVAGRYRGEAPVTFVVEGNYHGSDRAFYFSFDPARASTRNAFVPRLWAGRKIAMLEGAIRELGADLGLNQAEFAQSGDPRLKELIDEVVRLSTEFGILTEYTAFLARPEAQIATRRRIMQDANEAYSSRALGPRSGVGSLNQELNIMSRRNQKTLNYFNEYIDKDMRQVVINTVQQVNDRAFYKRGDRWIDSRLLPGAAELKPSRVVDFGTEAFNDLVWKLVAENRQGCLAVSSGEVLIDVDGEAVLVKLPQ